MKTPVLLRRSFIIDDEAVFDEQFDAEETNKTSRSARQVEYRCLNRLNPR